MTRYVSPSLRFSSRFFSQLLSTNLYSQKSAPLGHWTNQLHSFWHGDAYAQFPCLGNSTIHTLVVAKPDNGCHWPRAPLAAFAGAKKKYKPVAQKVQPMLADLPERFRIIRNIIGNPLASMPPLPTHPPPYKPTGRYTEERKLVIDNAHVGDFLWPTERDLMHHFMCLQQDGFVWNDSERRHFREDFFPPVEMPTVPHKPWIVRNLPIPLGIYPQVCKEI
jgi:hypothetical protein